MTKSSNDEESYLLLIKRSLDISSDKVKKYENFRYYNS